MKRRRWHGTRAPCFFNALKSKIQKFMKGAKEVPKGNIAKSYAISDAKIGFVSLVDKAANKHKFLITKSEGDTATIQIYGRIVKTDEDKHYVTGIVYEPMTEDTDGNYMTEEEITKAAHWFMKNSGKPDIQHCFEKADNVEIVESYVAKSDMEIEGQQIKKGTWLMTMEVADDDVWGKIEKGEITGFSMGGTGNYSTEDVDLSDPDNSIEKTQKKGIMKAVVDAVSKALHLDSPDMIEKGAVKDSYNKRIVRDNFWTAYYSLSDYLLETYNPQTGCYEPIHDETTIREALEDFNSIVVDLLADKDGVFKSIEKAGKKISTQNMETLKGIHESMGAFLEKFKEEEDEEVNKAEIEKTVTEAIAKAMSNLTVTPAISAPNAEGNVTKGENNQTAAPGNSGASEAITAEDIEKMVGEAIQKAMQPKEEPVTKESVEQMIQDAVAKAMEPVMKSVGVPSSLNDANLQKGADEEHYLHGFL